MSDATAPACDNEFLVLQFKHVADAFEAMVANDLVDAEDLGLVVMWRM